MKLYSYSSDLLKFVETKWALAKFAVGGILLGTLVLFGVVKMNQSVADTLAAHSANALSAENDILRQQLNLISPRVSNLEIQAERLKERGKGFHELLERRQNARDTVLSFTSVTNGLRTVSLISAAKIPRP